MGRDDSKPFHRYSDKRETGRPRSDKPAGLDETGTTTNLLEAAAASTSNPKPQGKPKKHPRSETPNFTPKALSTKPSPDRDDPLNSDLLAIDGVKGYVRSTANRTFQVDLSQFVTVVEASYNAQIQADRGLRKYLPFSAFYYYANIALWRRILQVYTSRGRYQVEYQELCSYLGDFEMVLPEDILLYIAGIGDVDDFSQRQWKMEVAAFPHPEPIDGLSGHFGRVDATTHILYETTPAPIIAIFKIIADLRRTQLEPAHGPVYWNIPEGLRPLEYDGVPSRNLLGWSPASVLTSEHINMYEAAGIRVTPDGVTDFDHRTIANIPINLSLIYAVSGALLASKCPVTKSWNDTPKGSVSQIPYATRPTTDEPTQHVFTTKELGSACYNQAGSSCACAAITFRYRVERSRGLLYRDTLCYPVYTQAWRDTCNQVFQAGNVGLWNAAEFRVAETSGLANAEGLAIRVRRSILSKSKSERS